MAGVKHDQPSARRLPAERAPLSSRCQEKIMRLRSLPGLLVMLLLAGCVGSVAKSVVTAPIKAAGAVVDATTTSQAEADRNRGREMRKAEERKTKERKRQEKEARKQAAHDGP
mgnify:CR=1 FL=1